jgi:hypothetical protein
VNVPAPNRLPDSSPVRLRLAYFATESSYTWSGSACDEWPPVHDRLHAVAD